MKKARTSPRQSSGSAPDVILAVRIQPRASKNAVVRTEEGALKIRLTAPPVDGAANEALVRFLAEALGLAKSQIEIVSGHTSREKRIKINGMSEENVKKLLNPAGK